MAVSNSKLEELSKQQAQKLDLAQQREEHYRHVKGLNERLKAEYNKVELVNQELISYIEFLERGAQANKASQPSDSDQEQSLECEDINLGPAPTIETAKTSPDIKTSKTMHKTNSQMSGNNFLGNKQESIMSKSQ